MQSAWVGISTNRCRSIQKVAGTPWRNLWNEVVHFLPACVEWCINIKTTMLWVHIQVCYGLGSGILAWKCSICAIRKTTFYEGWALPFEFRGYVNFEAEVVSTKWDDWRRGGGGWQTREMGRKSTTVEVGCYRSGRFEVRIGEPTWSMLHSEWKIRVAFVKWIMDDQCMVNNDW